MAILKKLHLTLGPKIGQGKNFEVYEAPTGDNVVKVLRPETPPEKLESHVGKLARLRKLGFRVPEVLALGDNWALVERIHGQTLKEIQTAGSALSPEQMERLRLLQSRERYEGFYIGDLNPKNLIWNEDAADWIIIDPGAIRQNRDPEYIDQKLNEQAAKWFGVGAKPLAGLRRKRPCRKGGRK